MSTSCLSWVPPCFPPQPARRESLSADSNVQSLDSEQAEKLAGKLLGAMAEMTPALTNHHRTLIDIRRVTCIPNSDWLKLVTSTDNGRVYTSGIYFVIIRCKYWTTMYPTPIAIITLNRRQKARMHFEDIIIHYFDIIFKILSQFPLKTTMEQWMMKNGVPRF